MVMNRGLRSNATDYGGCNHELFQVLVVYESSVFEPGWKSNRVKNLLEALSTAGIKFQYWGLRSLRVPGSSRLGVGKVRLFFLPNYVAATFGAIARPFLDTFDTRASRNCISQFLFCAKFLIKKRVKVVFTQTTLGHVASLSKSRGAFVIAECDMTFPDVYEKVMRHEYVRYNIPERLQLELPSQNRLKNEKKAFQAADRIVVFSENVKRDFPEYLRQKVDVVRPSHMVLDTSRHLLNFTKKNEKEIRFIFVGQVGFRKGFQYIFQMMADPSIRDLRIVCDVFGTITSSMQWFLDRRSEEVYSNILFHGQGDWCGNLDQREYRYVGLLPSLIEGSPRVAFEMAELGIPLIASKAGAPFFIEDGKSGVILEHPEKLSDAAKAFLSSSGEWSRIQKNMLSKIGQLNEGDYGNQIIQKYQNKLFSEH